MGYLSGGRLQDHISKEDQLPNSCQVLVVVPDRGLRRSLEFALEVEGFAVLSYEGLTAALASPHTTEDTCIVIDEEAVANDPLAIATLQHFRKPILLLMDGSQPIPDAPGIRVLRKPVLGNALIRAIRLAGEPRST